MLGKVQNVNSVETKHPFICQKRYNNQVANQKEPKASSQFADFWNYMTFFLIFIEVLTVFMAEQLLQWMCGGRNGNRQVEDRVLFRILNFIPVIRHIHHLEIVPNNRARAAEEEGEEVNREVVLH